MNLFFKISLSLLSSIMAILLQGCINDSPKESLVDVDTDHALVVLSVRSFDTGNGSPEDNISEKIESLRIIMIDAASGKIEYNKKIGVNELKSRGGSSQNSIYDFFLITNPGKKNFYLFANEESVPQLKGGSSKTLSELLASYPPFEENTNKGAELENYLNGAYFSPQYKIENDEIYLPYSSFYTLDMKGGVRYEETMFVVPVANKIKFIFTNNRSQDVDVKHISISSIAEENYLLARLAKEEQRKTFENTQIYWIDWLAKVSAASREHWEFSDNVSFNGTYGWILDYEIPGSSSANSHKEFTVVSEELNNLFTLKGKTDVSGDNPIIDTKSLKYIYLPESRYFPPQTDMQTLLQSRFDQTEQVYYLNLRLFDHYLQGIIETQVPLPNISSLFRNTEVIVKVSFNESTGEIYVEIKSWFSTDYFFGTVTES